MMSIGLVGKSGSLATGWGAGPSAAGEAAAGDAPGEAAGFAAGETAAAPGDVAGAGVAAAFAGAEVGVAAAGEQAMRTITLAIAPRISSRSQLRAGFSKSEGHTIHRPPTDARENDSIPTSKAAAERTKDRMNFSRILGPAILRVSPVVSM
jgi:hypothetical protein